MSTLPPPAIGQPAPDFKLKGPGGQPVTLSEYKGDRHVVLVFYPLAFSGTCSHQLPDVQRYVPEIEANGGTVFGISVDSHWSNEAFAKKLGLTFPLLSDWKREASAAYGVLLSENGYSERATFVVDRNGTLVHRDISDDIDDLSRAPSMEKVVAILKQAQ